MQVWKTLQRIDSRSLRNDISPFPSESLDVSQSLPLSIFPPSVRYVLCSTSFTGCSSLQSLGRSLSLLRRAGVVTHRRPAAVMKAAQREKFPAAFTPTHCGCDFGLVATLLQLWAGILELRESARFVRGFPSRVEAVGLSWSFLNWHFHYSIQSGENF